jgi:hypothetical protein
VRSRFNGRARNPWNEYECGSYYARAMASYALLIALSGFSYSAVTHTFSLAPQIQAVPFTCFFSAATGWGTVTLNQTSLEIRLVEGELRIATLQVTSGGVTTTHHPDRTLLASEGKVLFLLN